MDSNFIHIYSAYLNKGGANIAADSLFNGLKNSNDNSIYKKLIGISN